VKDRIEKDKPIKYINQYYGFPVVTNQEKALLIDLLHGVEQKSDRTWSVAYERMAHIRDDAGKVPKAGIGSGQDTVKEKGQMKLFGGE
jgi:hypothetical protein